MPRVLALRLERGLELEDQEFDLLYPEWGRWLSRIHWTPIEIARRAARLLVTRPGLRVLDVGSGVGKFAIVGSLVTDGLFYGIEQRGHFVDAARAVAARVGASRARFLHGNMTSLDWKLFDAFYLYNPFLENLRSLEPLDETVDTKPELYASYVAFVRQKLDDALPGTRVVTFHGFGGQLPPSYARAEQSGYLELWIRGPRPSP